MLSKWIRIAVSTIVLTLFFSNKVSGLHGTVSHEEDDTDISSGSSSSSRTQTVTSTKTKASKIPFVANNVPRPYQDPFEKGFEITARVYTGLDKLAHFDDNLPVPDKVDKSNDGENETSSKATKSSNNIILPYWECGVSGSNTAPIPVSTLTVRHLLGHQSAGDFSTGCGGNDHTDSRPRLIVPLTSLELLLNCGETRIFSPGDVILLENCLLGGHILQGFEGEDMVVAMLTLPFPYHHVGKERNSLSSILNWKQNPCRTNLVGKKAGHDVINGDNSQRMELENILSRWSQSSRFRRRLGLGVIGAGLSIALADFLGKVAPLALAVIFGAGALCCTTTYTAVKLGEYGLDELDLWNERRLLKLQDSNSDDSSTQEQNDMHGSKLQN